MTDTRRTNWHLPTNIAVGRVRPENTCPALTIQETPPTSPTRRRRRRRRRRRPERDLSPRKGLNRRLLTHFFLKLERSDFSATTQTVALALQPRVDLVALSLYGEISTKTEPDMWSCHVHEDERGADVGLVREASRLGDMNGSVQIAQLHKYCTTLCSSSLYATLTPLDLGISSLFPDFQLNSLDQAHAPGGNEPRTRHARRSVVQLPHLPGRGH